MTERIPTSSLALALAALAAVDLCVVGSGADAADGVEAVQPTHFPIEAYLSGQDIEAAQIAGVELKVRQDKGGTFLVDLHNPGLQARDLDLSVDCMKIEGMAMSRMGPVPELVSTDQLRLTLDPGADATRALSCTGPVPRADVAEADLEVPMTFLSYDFHVRTAEALAQWQREVEAQASAKSFLVERIVGTRGGGAIEDIFADGEDPVGIEDALMRLSTGDGVAAAE